MHDEREHAGACLAQRPGGRIRPLVEHSGDFEDPLSRLQLARSRVTVEEAGYGPRG
jgi:hypothetical protein